MTRDQMVQRAADVLDQHECIFVGTIEGYACGCDEAGVLDLPGLVEAEEHQARAILDAVFPQVSTAAELDALPSGSIVVSHNGYPFERGFDGGMYVGGEREGSTAQIAAQYAPLTVVWVPEVKL